MEVNRPIMAIQIGTKVRTKYGHTGEVIGALPAYPGIPEGWVKPLHGDAWRVETSYGTVIVVADGELYELTERIDQDAVRHPFL